MKMHKMFLTAICAGLLLSGCTGKRQEYDSVTLAMTRDYSKFSGSEHCLYVFDGGTVYYTDDRDFSVPLEEQIVSPDACTDKWECTEEFLEIQEVLDGFDFGSDEIAEAIKPADNGGWTCIYGSVTYYALTEKDGETLLMNIGERGLEEGEGNISSDIDEVEKLCRAMDKMADARPDRLTTGAE